MAAKRENFNNGAWLQVFFMDFIHGSTVQCCKNKKTKSSFFLMPSSYLTSNESQPDNHLLTSQSTR